MRAALQTMLHCPRAIEWACNLLKSQKGICDPYKRCWNSFRNSNSKVIG